MAKSLLLAAFARHNVLLQVADLDQSALSPAFEKEVLEISRIAGKDRAVAAAAESSASAPHHASRGYFKLKEGTQFQKEGSPKVRTEAMQIFVVKFLGVNSADNCKAILCIELLSSDERSVGW